MLRILYVEDNAANLSLVHRVARAGGHEVVNRTSGEAALRDFEAMKPHLVLMDIQLEGMLDGLQVVRELRRQGYTLPIVAVTAYAMKGDKEKALDAGCDAYLPKPLPIAELVRIINACEAGTFKEQPAPTPENPPAAEAPTVVLDNPPVAEADTQTTLAADAEETAESSAHIAESELETAESNTVSPEAASESDPAAPDTPNPLTVSDKPNT